MEDKNKTFYYLNDSILGASIETISGDNVQWKETQGYTYNKKRVYVSVFALISYKKRNYDKFKNKENFNLFNQIFTNNIVNGISAIYNNLVEFIKNFFIFIGRILAFPMLIIWSFWEYIIYKNHIKFINNFNDKNEDETEYLFERDAKNNSKFK